MKLIEEHIEEQSDGEVIIYQTVIMDPIEHITLHLKLAEEKANPCHVEQGPAPLKGSNGQHTT